MKKLLFLLIISFSSYSQTFKTVQVLKPDSINIELELYKKDIQIEKLQNDLELMRIEKNNQKSKKIISNITLIAVVLAAFGVFSSQK
jgi:hypothetical protein